MGVGAFLGYGTLRIAALLGTGGRVIAFESDSKILPILRRNIEENNMHNVTIVPKGAADYSGEGSFFCNNGTANSLQRWVLANRGYKDMQAIKIPVDTIDNVLKTLSIESVNLVNITVNGGEVEALAGMQQTLNASDDVKITLAGWYYRSDNKKVCDIVEPQLQQKGLTVIKGRLGRVLAWKRLTPFTPGNQG